jgi:hypothetical protein
VYLSFDPGPAVQGIAAPTGNTYSIYDLVGRDWIAQFGPLESGLELGQLD